MPYEYAETDLQIYKAALSDDWDDVCGLFSERPELMTKPVNERLETPLMIAVGTNCSHKFVKQLLDNWPHHNARNYEGNTALHYACKVGNVIDAKLLVEFRLMEDQNLHGDTPLLLAAKLGRMDMLDQVFKEHPTLVNEQGNLIISSIQAGFLEFALLIVYLNPPDEITPNALEALATKPEFFPSGNRLGFCGRLIYQWMPIIGIEMPKEHEEVALIYVATLLQVGGLRRRHEKRVRAPSIYVGGMRRGWVLRVYRLDFGENSRKNQRMREDSQNSSAKTFSARYRNTPERPQIQDRLRNNDGNVCRLGHRRESAFKRLSDTYSPSTTKSGPDREYSRDDSYSRGRPHKRNSSPRRDRPQIRGRSCGVEESYGNTYSSYITGDKHRYHPHVTGRSSSMKRGRNSESPLSRVSKSGTSEGGHWKSKSKRRKPTDEEDLAVPWSCEEVERWAMPTWCHMFKSTLIGTARVWFDELPPESIDGYTDLKAAFLAYFMQQKKYVKDPVEIHNIKQKDGETIEEFMERIKIETGRIKRAPECMRISRFMHGVNNLELIKRLNERVPKTLEEMMTATADFIRGETAAASKKKLRKQIEELVRAGKLSHFIKEIRIVTPFLTSIGRSNPSAATPLSVSWTPIKAIIKYRWPNKIRKRQPFTLEWYNWVSKVESALEYVKTWAPTIKNICDIKTKNEESNATMKKLCKIVIEKKRSDSIIWSEFEGYNLFHLAIKERQVQVYNLVYQMSGHKAFVASELHGEENALHIAAKLAPSHRL
nr:reverse transcriptase domain-containing protein [Tanacetum cinerariifolium]